MTATAATASDVRACFYASYWAGSVQIRGVEVASARTNWTFTRCLTEQQIRDHDVFCIIKKPDRALMTRLRAMGKVVVYDTVDPWRQPDDGLACDSMARVHDYFSAFLRNVPADGVIFANAVMREDLGQYVANPTHIYHHYQPDLAPVPVRDKALTVGYCGVAAYLGDWYEAIERACRRNGLSFLALDTARFTAAGFAEFDIGVVARGGSHGSLMACRYKSNVKLANLYGAAIPCAVADTEQSCRETTDGHVRFFSTEAELTGALHDLREVGTRLRIRDSFLRTRERFSLGAISRQFEDYFRQLLLAGRCAPPAQEMTCSN